MKNVPVLIPDDKTVSNFQAFCNSIFEQQEILEEENKKLSNLRDTLLPKLMNGEINIVPPKVNLDKFIKANKVVKMTGVVIDFSSIPVA